MFPTIVGAAPPVDTVEEAELVVLPPLPVVLLGPAVVVCSAELLALLCEADELLVERVVAVDVCVEVELALVEVGLAEVDLVEVGLTELLLSESPPLPPITLMLCQVPLLSVYLYAEALVAPWPPM